MNDKIFIYSIVIKWVRLHLELVFWAAGICFLFFMNTNQSQASLCIFRLIGFDRCPGCGLGHSICHALHFRFAQSFQEHLLGIPALAIILSRLKQLTYSKKTIIYEN